MSVIACMEKNGQNGANDIHLPQGTIRVTNQIVTFFAGNSVCTGLLIFFLIECFASVPCPHLQFPAGRKVMRSESLLQATRV